MREATKITGKAILLALVLAASARAQVLDEPSTIPEPKMRTWTATNGKTTVGVFIELLDDNRVSIQKKSGIQVPVPIEKLSVEDQDYLVLYGLQLQTESIPLDLSRKYTVVDLPEGQQAIIRGVSYETYETAVDIDAKRVILEDNTTGELVYDYTKTVIDPLEHEETSTRNLIPPTGDRLVRNKKPVKISSPYSHIWIEVTQAKDKMRIYPKWNVVGLRRPVEFSFSRLNMLAGAENKNIRRAIRSYNEATAFVNTRLVRPATPFNASEPGIARIHASSVARYEQAVHRQRQLKGDLPKIKKNIAQSRRNLEKQIIETAKIVRVIQSGIVQYRLVDVPIKSGDK